MTSMFSSGWGITQVADENPKGHLPHPPIQALKQGGVLSDLQRMIKDEQQSHMQGYRYRNGHNDGSAPLGEPSF